MNYLVHGPAIAKDEIYGALDVTFFEIMAASVVAKSVLCTVESTAGEIGFVSGYAKRRRLPPLHSRHGCRCCVLHHLILIYWLIASKVLAEKESHSTYSKFIIVWSSDSWKWTHLWLNYWLYDIILAIPQLKLCTLNSTFIQKKKNILIRNPSYF